MKCKYLKWACITHLDIWNTSYGQKKGWESNGQFDSRPLKVKNQPNSLACRWHATYRWKAWGLQLCFRPHLNHKFAHKVMGFKVAKIPTVKISRLPLGSPGTKCHLDLGLVERHRVYYKGEGGGFPQVQAMVSLVSPNYSWLFLTPKMFQLCTNHFVLVLCRSMWVVEACQFFLVPFRSSSTPFYPSKVLWTKECAPTLYSSVVFYLDSHLNPSRHWECVK